MRIIILCDGEPTPFALRLVHRENGTYKMCAALIIGIEPIARNIKIEIKQRQAVLGQASLNWLRHDFVISKEIDIQNGV